MFAGEPEKDSSLKCSREDRQHRRWSGGALFRPAHEEGGPRPRHRRRRAQPGRRHLRLRRRLLRRDARGVRGGRPRDVGGDRQELRPLGRHRHPLPGRGADLDGPRLLRHVAPAPARHSPAALRGARRVASVPARGRRPRRLPRRRPDPRRRRRQQHRPRALRGALQARDRLAAQQVRLARHHVSVSGLHVHLQGERARALACPRVSLRPVHVHLHPRDDGGDVAARRPRPVGRGSDTRLRRASLRRGAAWPPAPQEPLALAQLPDRAERLLAPRERRPAGRRRAHRALLDRLGDEARHGGRDRARAGAPAPRRGAEGALRVRGGAAARGRGPPAGRPGEPRVVRGDRALSREARAAPVRGEPAHAEPPRHPR